MRTTGLNAQIDAQLVSHAARRQKRALCITEQQSRRAKGDRRHDRNPHKLISEDQFMRNLRAIQVH
jgi:hypothetical protein